MGGGVTQLLKGGNRATWEMATGRQPQRADAVPAPRRARRTKSVKDTSCVLIHKELISLSEFRSFALMGYFLCVLSKRRIPLYFAFMGIQIPECFVFLPLWHSFVFCLYKISPFVYFLYNIACCVFCLCKYSPLYSPL